MSSLFTPLKIQSLTIPTRIARAATGESLADENGRMPESLAQYYIRQARDGVGLIQPGYAFVSERGRCSPNQTGIHTDEAAEAMRTLVEGIHAHGGTVVLQLVYNFARSLRMDIEQLAKIRDDFAAAAARAKNVGFDGISLHAAHGYLLSQFISPFYNRRTDRYGGSVRNRAAFPLEVLAAVREKVGSDYFVMAKINTSDFLGEKGLNDEMSLENCEMLAKAGIDMIETSGGMPRSTGEAWGKRSTAAPEDEAFFSNFAQQLKNRTGIAVMLTGGVRSCRIAEKIIDEGVADLVGFARPLIAEPGLAKRWRDGDRDRSLCKDCGGDCLDELQQGIKKHNE